MNEIVFFVEEPSAKAMLEGIMPKLSNESINVKYIVFEGKQDLEKRLPIRLKRWENPNAHFLVIRDQDSGNCINIKNNLKTICCNAGRPEAIIRIACHELESFYLGDLRAVEKAMEEKGLAGKQNKKKYRSPDNLRNASEELKKIAKKYQKVSGSRAIGKELSIHENKSESFNQLIKGINKLLSSC